MIAVTENLYQSLCSKANVLVAASFKNYPERQVKELAHDITVDFLFFSKSFAVTIREDQGELTPFFASYVRKKCLGMWVRSHKHGHCSTDTVYPLVKDETPFEDRFEIRESLKRMVAELAGYQISYGSGKKKRVSYSIPLDRLLMALLRTAADNGECSTVSVCKILGVSNKATVADAVGYLKKVLIEKYHLGE